MNEFLLKTLTVFIVICIALCFDKKELQKGYKMNEYEKSEHHPISRRVLRFERSTDKDVEKFEGDDVSQDMPMPADFFQPILDFAKPQPELPIKVKPSHIDPDLDYQPDLEFK